MSCPPSNRMYTAITETTCRRWKTFLAVLTGITLFSLYGFAFHVSRCLHDIVHVTPVTTLHRVAATESALAFLAHSHNAVTIGRRQGVSEQDSTSFFFFLFPSPPSPPSPPLTENMVVCSRQGKTSLCETCAPKW